MRSILAAFVLGSAVIGCTASDGATPPTSSLTPRTFRMGFSTLPPKLTNESVIGTIDAWSKRGDAAIMHNSVPYRALLTGTSAATYVNTVDLPLANYLRGKGLALTFTVDVTDGLNRAAEAPELVALKRSITETAVQAVYRQYVQAVASIIRPEYLGLAAETNLIRDMAPTNVYTALVQMTNAAAADVRTMSDTKPTLYVSLQADVAWGPPPAAYRGVETDFRDFPFIQAVAISSYPYFMFSDPNQIPLDYYVRLLNARSLPVLVVEGGWTSASLGAVQSSAATQASYLRRQERLLDSAKAVALFQITYADLDLSQWPPQPPGSILPLFAHLGLVDSELRPKTALATYDSIFARPLRK